MLIAMCCLQFFILFKNYYVYESFKIGKGFTQVFNKVHIKFLKLRYYEYTVN